MQRQTYGYCCSFTALLPSVQYQTILLGDVYERCAQVVL